MFEIKDKEQNALKALEVLEEQKKCKTNRARKIILAKKPDVHLPSTVS